MSDLTAVEKQKLEKALEMSTGYVLNFSNNSFTDFVFNSVGLDITCLYEPAIGWRWASFLKQIKYLLRTEPLSVLPQTLSRTDETCPYGTPPTILNRTDL